MEPVEAPTAPSSEITPDDQNQAVKRERLRPRDRQHITTAEPDASTRSVAQRVSHQAVATLRVLQDDAGAIDSAHLKHRPVVVDGATAVDGIGGVGAREQPSFGHAPIRLRRRPGYAHGLPRRSPAHRRCSAR